MGIRICFGGIHIESTTFTSYISNEDDFRIKREEEIINYYSFLNFEEFEITPIPLLLARAIPGGVVSRSFFDRWMTEYLLKLENEIQKEPVDGIFLDIHGAMSVEGLNDAEGFLASKIREVVGKNVVMIASMDLHGNVSNQLFDACDLLTCYRTAPHIDVIETKQRAFLSMMKVIKDNLKVFKAKVDIPILLPGEKTSTEVEPGKTLYGKLDEITSIKGIIDASIWMGFPWADQPRCHSVIVITGTDENVIKMQIENISRYYWDIKEQFTFVGPVAYQKDAIKEALRSKVKPYFISDTGDNPGAGGAGDITTLLRLFLEEDSSKKILFSSIFDRSSINEIYRHNVNDLVHLALGGKVDPKYGDPLPITAKIRSFFIDDVAGKSAVIQVKNIDIIVTERRYQYGTKEAYQVAGVFAPEEYDIIVVKMGYLEPDLSKLSNGWVMALTDGAVNQDLRSIDYKLLKRPVYPLDDFEFQPEIIIKNNKHY